MAGCVYSAAADVVECSFNATFVPRWVTSVGRLVVRCATSATPPPHQLLRWRRLGARFVRSFLLHGHAVPSSFFFFSGSDRLLLRGRLPPGCRPPVFAGRSRRGSGGVDGRFLGWARRLESKISSRQSAFLFRSAVGVAACLLLLAALSVAAAVRSSRRRRSVSGGSRLGGGERNGGDVELTPLRLPTPPRRSPSAPVLSPPCSSSPCLFARV